MKKQILFVIFLLIFTFGCLGEEVPEGYRELNWESLELSAAGLGDAHDCIDLYEENKYDEALDECKSAEEKYNGALQKEKEACELVGSGSDLCATSLIEKYELCIIPVSQINQKVIQFEKDKINCSDETCSLELNERCQLLTEEGEEIYADCSRLGMNMGFYSKIYSEIECEE